MCLPVVGNKVHTGISSFHTARTALRAPASQWLCTSDVPPLSQALLVVKLPQGFKHTHTHLHVRGPFRCPHGTRGQCTAEQQSTIVQSCDDLPQCGSTAYRYSQIERADMCLDHGNPHNMCCSIVCLPGHDRACHLQTGYMQRFFAASYAAQSASHRIWQPCRLGSEHKPIACNRQQDSASCQVLLPTAI